MQQTERVAARPRRERVYFGAMDGLRAVAVAGVFVLHLSNLTGMTLRPEAYAAFTSGNVDAMPAGSVGPLLPVVGYAWTAVPVFFAISGFLLFWPWAVAAREGRRMPSVPAYYWHRFLRIMPAYWLMLLVTLFVFYRDVFADGWRLLRLLTLQQVVVLSDLPETDFQPPHGGALSQTWSLGTEFQFYLVLPLLAVVLYRLLTRRRIRATYAVLGLLVLGTVVWRTTVSGPFLSQGDLGRFWITAWMAYFAIGILLAVAAVELRYSTARPPRLVRLTLRRPWLGWVAAVAAYLLALPLRMVHPVLEEVCVLVICAGLTAPVALASGKGPERLLRRPVMSWLGRISYGVFLWHIFVQLAVLRIAGLEWGRLSFVDFLILLPVTGALSVLVAWLSYVLLEQPLRRRFRLRSGQRDVGRDVPDGPLPRDAGEPVVPAAPRSADAPVQVGEGAGPKPGADRAE